MSSPPTPSPASLASIPPEIMRYIAKAAAHQDERYRLLRTEAQSLLPEDTTAFGRSLSALSMASKAWRAQTESFLFETLSTEQLAAPVFVTDIQHRYRQHFRQINLHNGYLLSALDTLTAALPFLTGLRSLHIDAGAFRTLFDDVETVDGNMRWRVFQDLAPMISELSISLRLGSNLARFLSLFPHLHILSFDALNFYDPGALEVMEAMASMSQLKELTIKTLDHHIPSLPAGWEELNWSFRRSLISLTIDISETRSDVVLPDEMWSFVHLFADTLQSLDLSFDALDARLARRAKSHSTAFPSLRHLALACSPHACLHIFSLIEYPPLAHLTLHPRYPMPFGSAEFPEVLDTALERFAPTLRHFDWTFPTHLPSDWSRADQADRIGRLEDLCHSSGITLNTHHGLRDPFPRLNPIDQRQREEEPEIVFAFEDGGPKARSGEWERDLLEQGAATREVLSFAEDMVARMERTKDCEGMDELMKLVRPLRARMLVDRD